jgi:hypothetical protein
MNTKQRLSALEKQFTLTGTQPRTPEESAMWQRMGLSAHAGHVSSTPPEDIRRIGEILAGNYPETMTADDIEWFNEAKSMLEAAL